MVRPNEPNPQRLKYSIQDNRVPAHDYQKPKEPTRNNGSEDSPLSILLNRLLSSMVDPTPLGSELGYFLPPRRVAFV